MNITSLLIIALCIPGVAGAQTNSITIPLDQVWSLNMPGTKPLSLSQGETPDVHGRESEQLKLNLLRRTLATRNPKQAAMAGFAVNAESLPRGLTWALSGIRRNEPFNNSELDTDREAYLVFFSYELAYRVEIRQITRLGNQFRIQYQFVPTYSVESSNQFALIQVGILPAGEYSVVLERLPLEQKYLEAGFKEVTDEQARRSVCLPFEFSVHSPRRVAEESDSPATSIPLGDIWGWNIPGTRPMAASPTANGYTTAEGALLDDIRKHLKKLPGKGPAKRAEAGFVVPARDMDALKNAHSVLVKNKAPSSTFMEGEELTLVFFSYPSTSYVHIHDVEVEENKIRVHFKFVHHGSQNITRHFALIPLPNLRKGKYEVIYERVEIEDKYSKAGWPNRPQSADKLVCDSFTFAIEKQLER